MRRVALCILVLVCAPLAQGRGWLKLSSPHFELYTSAGEKRGREAISYFEQVRDVFARIRGPQADARKIRRLIAFSNEKEYQPFRMGPNSPAYYVHSDDLDCIVLNSISGDYSPIAVHEYTHLWMRGTGASLPAWLHEGLAEVHSTLNQRGGKVWIGNAIPARLRRLRQEHWIPFERLTLIDHDSPEFSESNRAGILYAESWLLAHMLYLDEPFRPQWSAFIRTLIDTGSTEQAAFKAYGKTLADLQRAAEAYARRDNLPALWFDARLEKPSEAPSVTEPSDMEFAVVFAQLYRLIGKPEAGKKLLADVSGTSPANAAMEEERAALARKAGDLEGARAHYLNAIELRSTNAQMYIDYAELVHQQRAEDAARALARALELQPDSTEAHFLLGYVLAQQSKWKEALPHLGAVREVSPERAFLLFHLLARAQFESGLVNAARQSAAKAQKYASNASETAAAKTLAQQIGANHPLQAPVPAVVAGAPAASPPKADGYGKVEGTLRLLDCQRTGARLHVRTAGGEVVLLIDDPARIALATPDGAASVNLSCGPQKPRTVRVEYAPVNPGITGVAGRLTRLELLP